MGRHRSLLTGVAASALLGLAFAFSATPALAYFDPNAGGFLFQILSPLIAMAAGAALFLRRRAIASLRRLFRTGAKK